MNQLIYTIILKKKKYAKVLSKTKTVTIVEYVLDKNEATVFESAAMASVELARISNPYNRELHAEPLR